MKNIKNNGNYFALIVLVTDIIKEGSYFWIVSDESERIYSMFNIDENNNYIQGVLSRKKQVVPVLEEKLK